MMKYTPDFSSRFRILKGGKISLVVSALLAGSTMTFAAPSGGTVTSGSATINHSGSVTTINQSSNKASINWQDFSIAKNETVNFVQPSAHSVTLNRVVGTTKSLIEGAMNANGQVFLLNPNGVLFANGSQINVGGLVASTLNITDANFQSGNYVFEGNSQNSIINMGTITANNGYVAMMGKHIANEGTIVATMGNVQLASGEKISLNLNGNSLVKLAIDQGTMDALVENKGLIKADGGQVYLTTQALNTILDGMVNNTGIIEAQTLNDVTGKVILFAHGGTTTVSGSIDASGGFVETSGDVLHVKNDFKVKADTWLLDPKDFTIAASGGDMSGATLSSNLGTADVIIQSTSGATNGSGHIYVNDAISWSSNHSLELNAQNDIYIHDNITATGATAKVKLYYGQGAVEAGNTADYYILPGKSISLHAGQNFDTKLGSDGSVKNYTVITALGSEGSTTGTDLQGINGNLSGNYVLGADIDASATSTWESGNGFKPLWIDGMSSSPIRPDTLFSGTFSGLGHTVSNLTINRPSEGFVGLFGEVSGTVRNVGILNGTFITLGESGPLVGYLSQTGKVIFSYSTANIIGSSNEIGGLVGRNYGSILNSYATGSVTITGTNPWDYGAGGLVGLSEGHIINSYATGAVSGGSQVGGLVGREDAGSITNSYATGLVTSTDTTRDGGLVGYTQYTPTVTNSYWDMDTTGQADSFAGGTGKTTAQFLTLVTDASWNTNVWDDSGYAIAQRPYLKYVTRDATYFSGGHGTSNDPYTIVTATQLQNIAELSSPFYYKLLNNIDMTGVSTWNVIGDAMVPFTGTFDGSNHVISNFTTNDNDWVGLFGYIDGATIKNVGLVNANITAFDRVGGLVGYSVDSTIDNTYVTGTITAHNEVGGLVGYSENTTISNSYTTGTVSGNRNIGGLVGYNRLSTTQDSYSTASADASSRTAGGLVGMNDDSTITNSYSTGAVTGNDSGGLVGYNINASSISNSYWNVQSSGMLNGLGWEQNTATSTIMGHVNYTLSNETHNYQGTPYSLNDLWNSSTLFGASLSSWQEGTDYVFKYNGSTVTGFTNAGTYNNITIDVLKSGFSEAVSGNTHGTLTITGTPDNINTATQPTSNIITTIVNQTAITPHFYSQPTLSGNTDQPNLGSPVQAGNQVRVAIIPNLFLDVIGSGMRLPDGLE